MNRRPAAPPGKLAPAIALSFLAALAIAAGAGKLPIVVPAFYATISLIAFIAYAIDKSAARKNEWRTPEHTLHLLALFGGWPGALLAQHRLRHKSRKASFLWLFRLTALVNCGALGWLFAGAGGKAWRMAIGID